MSHSYSSSLFHCTFSTKDRRNSITPALQARLWPYLAGIAKENGIRVMAVGGVADHAHLLLSLPSTMVIAKAIQLVKGGSSKWIHDTFAEHRDFAWQESYGAFSVGVSQVARTIRYIQAQEEHHRKQTFQQEFIAFLKKHQIEYDPRYIWS